MKRAGLLRIGKWTIGLALRVVTVLALVLLTAPLAAEAQKVGKVPRIGYIRAEAPPAADIETFRQGLREHGYMEGKNIVVEYRWADGNEQRLRAIVAELIRLKVTSSWHRLRPRPGPLRRSPRLFRS